MNAIFVEIVTSPNCPYSPKAIKLAKELVSKIRFPLILKEISLATEEGLTRAGQFEITATPTIAINGRVAFVGVPTKNDLLAAIMEIREKESETDSSYF